MGEWEDLAEDFRNETGIDLNSVRYAQVFVPADALLGLPPGMDGDELETGVTLYGKFDEAEIVARSRSAGQTENGSFIHRGHNVYFEKDEYGRTAFLGFIGSGVMVLGTESGVLAVLDAAAGDTAASGRAVEALESLGERDLGFAVETQRHPSEGAPSEGAPSGRENLIPETGLAGLLDRISLAAPVSATGMRFSDGALESNRFPPLTAASTPPPSGRSSRRQRRSTAWRWRSNRRTVR